jgi:uncharacterized protein YukE
MSMVNIHVDPESILHAQTKVAAVEETFAASLAEAKEAVEACNWLGAAADAFRVLFAEAETQFAGVREQLTGMAEILATGVDGFSSVDEQIAAGISGNTG